MLSEKQNQAVQKQMIVIEEYIKNALSHYIFEEREEEEQRSVEKIKEEMTQVIDYLLGVLSKEDKTWHRMRLGFD